jgi:hypothetical protein
MLSKDDLLLIGIGEAGNRILSEILKKDKRYIGLFINTSYKDVLQVDNAKNVYLIPSSDGTGRNRHLAQMYVKDYVNSIIDQIDKFPLQRNITVLFSMGGGSGSGIAPLLIKLLNKVRPNKVINIVAILPSIEESNKVKENAIECWNEIVEISNIRTSFILDNNKRENKYQINKEFANLFDSMMDISKLTESNLGVIDTADAEVLITAKGSTGIYQLDENESDTKVALAKAYKRSIFVDFSKDECNYLGISLLPDSDINRNDLVKHFKPKKDRFIEGFNEKCNLVIVSGCNIGLQKGAIEYLDLGIADTTDETIEVSATEDLMVGKNKKNSAIIEDNAHMSNLKSKAKEKDMDKLLDDDALWNDIMNM